MVLPAIPSTIFVAFGVVTAALLTGFFSYLNMVSAKENKVSEFRLTWVDGLRDEIAAYAAAMQELVRVAKNQEILISPDDEEDKIRNLSLEKHKVTREAYETAIQSWTKIHLRINPKHLDDINTPEAQLISALKRSKEYFNNSDYSSAFNCTDEIIEKASPLLKETWDHVKNGESGYQKIRSIAAKILITGITSIVLAASAIVVYSAIKSTISYEESTPPTPSKEFTTDSYQSTNILGCYSACSNMYPSSFVLPEHN